MAHNPHGGLASDLLPLLQERATSRVRRLAIEIVLHHAFDLIMGFVILLNMAVMIIETNKIAVEKESADSSASWTDIFGWVALFVFVFELILRILALKSLFWKCAWNKFDFVIVLVDAIVSPITLFVGDAFPVSILRVFRLAKLARVSKVLRVFPELRVLLVALVGSARAIVWGLLLLLLVLLVFSMVAVSFIHPLATSFDFGDCTGCSDAYSSVERSMLTLWQQLVLGDNWGLMMAPLMETYPGTVLFFTPAYMVIGMALINLILGVVVQVALAAKEQIEDEDRTEAKLLKKESETHLLDLCRQMDTNCDGMMKREEAFSKLLEPGEFRRTILRMDVDEEDFEILWTVIDPDNTGVVPYKELVTKIYSIKNSDSDFLLAYIKYYITSIRNDLLQTIRLLGFQVDSEFGRVETEIHHIQRESTFFLKRDSQPSAVEGHFSADSQPLNRDSQPFAAEYHVCERNLPAWEVLEEYPEIISKGAGFEVHEASRETSQVKCAVRSSQAPVGTAEVGNPVVAQASIHSSHDRASQNAVCTELIGNNKFSLDGKGPHVEVQSTVTDLTRRFSKSL